MLTQGYQDVPAGMIASVVTCLEMRTRPDPRPEPADAPWVLRRRANPDPDAYRRLFSRIGAPWLWFSRLVMPPEELAGILRHPEVEIHVVEAGGVEEGLLELDFREREECELSFFGLTAALQGRGAGRWLMNRALERAFSRPVRRFWVHTCSLDHPAVLPFYLRSGFRAYARRVEVAGDPRLSGILPRDAAPQVPVLAPERV